MSTNRNPEVAGKEAARKALDAAKLEWPDFVRRIARITGYSEQELLTMAIADVEAVQSAENIRTDKRIRRCKSSLHD